MPSTVLFSPALERRAPADCRPAGRSAPVWRAAMLVLVGTWCLVGLSANTVAAEFVVTPPQVKFDRNFERAQLLVSAVDAAGQVSSRSVDLTGDAQYTSANPAVATVSATGNLRAVSNGQTTITVTHEGVAKIIEVVVEGVVPQPAVSFTEHVLPILYKAGCNGGSCHASQHGKGGFTLSVMGFDPPADRNMIVRDRMQRRVNLLVPEESLFLRKPLMELPHGGGRRLTPGSNDHEILKAWIASGATEPKADAPKVERLVVNPSERIGTPGFRQQLRVQAVYSNGATRDVTAWARYDSMDDSVVSVSSSGMMTAIGRGQAPVMIRFEGQAEIAMTVIPFADTVPLNGWQSRNFIDDLAAAKFLELGITPSGLCDDSTFVRLSLIHI